MTSAPPPVPGETRDWSVVIDHGCAECGWQPIELSDAPALLRASVERWRTAMSRPGASTRPDPAVWSPVEYACHTRDMVRLLGERTQAMLDAGDPQFTDWDGDAKAVELAYWQADPTATAADYATCADATISVLDSVRAGQWSRPGHRSDGMPFTVATLTQYLMHEVEHHLHDVGA